MNELVKMVTQKTGLSEDKAKMVVDLVVGYLKGKLPASLAGQLDSAAGGGGGLGDAAKGLGGLLGRE